MSNIIFVILCLATGMILRKTNRLPEHTSSALNGFIIHLSLPALTLIHIHSIKMDWIYLFPALMPWFFFAAGSAFFILAGRWLNIPPKSVGCLILTCALGNTSFVGLPMIEAFFGKEYLSAGLVVDQAGTFVVLSTFGIIAAARYSSGKVPASMLLKRVLTFPPFYAFVLALVLKPVAFPDWLSLFLDRLGATLIPLALLSVGLQIRFHSIRMHLKKIMAGLFFKLFLGPALMLILFVYILGGKGTVLQVTLFEAAMPPIIMGSVVAMEHKLDPPLATLLLGIGIPLSIFTLTGWYYLFQRLAV